MTFNKTLLTATMLTLGGFSAMTGANAADNPATGEFNVSLKVNSVCTVKSAGNVDLGEIEAGLATTAVTKTAVLTLNCSEGAIPVISLTPSSSSTNGTGTMKGSTSAQTVPYKLTSGSAAGTAWGSGTSALTLPAAVKYATNIDTTIYATVEDAADVKPDTYSDTVTVSVAY